MTTTPTTAPTAPTTTLRRRVGWGTVTVLATGIALISARYLTLDPDTFLQEQRATYLAHLTPLVLHVAGGIVALVLGPWQFPPRLRARRPAVHRWVGRLYLTAVAATGVGGLLLAPHGLFAPAAPLGFAVLAVLLLATSAAALVTIRRGAVERHRRWMVRSYALIFTGVTFRLWLMVLGSVGVPFDQAYVSGAWGALLLDLAVAERVLAGGREHRPVRSRRPRSPGADS
ncbi:DUF2306 domain-containing protein [Kitasatospora sp. NPDC048540]|uniref:DUF2306 domain-containing protein n=1 Tax=Kitasatospora sp. NPDC048540 TaxID=3155634 RepID=UPI0033FC71A3